MLRALYTSWTGMMAQKRNVDIISNNIANINTPGYKTSQVSFEELINNKNKEKVKQNKNTLSKVGNGVKISSISTDFSVGNIKENNNNLSCAINGNGFFKIQTMKNEKLYTRNGDFSVSNTKYGYCLSDNNGNLILDKDNNYINLDDCKDINKINIDLYGTISYTNNNDELSTKQLGIYQFKNPNGLYKINNGNYKITESSGNEISELDLEESNKSSIEQGYLESSNVNIVNEMVDLMMSQRLYEANAKVIQRIDEMMSLGNKLGIIK